MHPCTPRYFTHYYTSWKNHHHLQKPFFQIFPTEAAVGGKEVDAWEKVVDAGGIEADALRKEADAIEKKLMGTSTTAQTTTITM